MKTHTMKSAGIVFPFMILLVFALIFSCTKNHSSGPYTLNYGDSILYLKNQLGDYIVYPTEQRSGHYTAFPEGIDIDEHTGAINVSKSETGLRYRVTHTADDGQVTSTIVLLSGMTYFDKFYHLSQGDSIASPVYNASTARVLPTSGSVFDEGNAANGGGCSVKTLNAQINLAETVRNGVFGAIPQNDAKQEFDIVYRLNDESGKAKNKLRVKLYYYATMNDVAADLIQTLNDRESQGVFLGNSYGLLPTDPAVSRNSGLQAIAKPRPPCIIIIGQ